VRNRPGRNTVARGRVGGGLAEYVPQAKPGILREGWIVPRGNVNVRQPSKRDLPALLEMWEELRQDSGRTGPLAPAPSESTLLEIIGWGAGSADYRAVVGEIEGGVVGMAYFSVQPASALVDCETVQIDYLHVRSAFTRRGVGHALVAAAAAFADQVGAEHVSVGVFPHVREANRFYAKIGFSPLIVRRIAPVSALRHALSPEQVSLAHRAGALARRRVVVRSRSQAPATAAARAARI
jgi:GNAT superfamily N-acetyltransferase